MTQKIVQLRTFAHAHDDLPAFHAAYLIFTFLAAALLNLGFFGLLIIGHMSLDVVKYRDFHGYSWKTTIEGVVRESLVDITLLLVGVVFVVYLHHSAGIASLSGLMRAEITVLSGLGIMVPKLKILHHVLKIMSHLYHYLETVHPKIHHGWSSLDLLCFHFIVVAILLILMAAPLMDVPFTEVQAILSHELVPWHI